MIAKSRNSSMPEEVRGQIPNIKQYAPANWLNYVLAALINQFCRFFQNCFRAHAHKSAAIFDSSDINWMTFDMF